ncbi:MAG: HIT domain-containing protein [Planctomycetes bacterium]|nr:HIT domain-containing protein [Planctomycetota bacterium]
MPLSPFNHLWAPWRMEYIHEVDRLPGCFFCRAIRAATKSDAKNLLILRGRRAFVMLNKYPYNVGHVMIFPKSHTGDLTKIRAAELNECMALAQRMQRALTKAFRPDGFNLGVNLGRSAGAGVLDHVHIHLVPRWSGDCNFMPVLGGTKVHPQSLEECWGTIRKSLELQ